MPSLREYETALKFLADRIDYERMRIMPYGVAEFRLGRMRQLFGAAGQSAPRLARRSRGRNQGERLDLGRPGRRPASGRLSDRAVHLAPLGTGRGACGRGWPDVSARTVRRLAGRGPARGRGAWTGRRPDAAAAGSDRPISKSSPPWPFCISPAKKSTWPSWKSGLADA